MEKGDLKKREISHSLLTLYRPNLLNKSITQQVDFVVVRRQSSS